MKKNLYIGGYSILDLADANVYAQALICAKQNKPVLVYDDPLRYYADTITIDTDNDDNVVITKGGKTITITDANAVSSEGDIQEVYNIDLGNLSEDADDINSILNFDNFIITEDLYNKLISGKSIIKAKLYDGVDYIGNINWVSHNDGKSTSNVLVKTEKRFYYFDETDNAMGFVSIGQLEDNRYYLLCSNITQEIVNA